MIHSHSYYLAIALLLSGSSVIAVAKKSYTEVKSMNEFNAIVNDTRPAVISFYAPWCGACVAMDKTFCDAADTYSEKAHFAKVDVTNDKLKEIVDGYGIQATPTIVYKEVGMRNKDQFNQRLKAFLGEPKKTITKKPVKKSPKAVKKPKKKTNY